MIRCHAVINQNTIMIPVNDKTAVIEIHGSALLRTKINLVVGSGNADSAFLQIGVPKRDRIVFSAYPCFIVPPKPRHSG